MFEDFFSWSVQKIHIESSQRSLPNFHEQEIWWCSIGVNIGDEQDGKNKFYERPVLILKKFNKRIAWVLPLTSKKKEGPYYHVITYDNKIATVILSQLRLVSVKRFRRKLSRVSTIQMTEVKNKIIRIIV